MSLDYLKAEEGFLGLSSTDSPLPEKAGAVIIPFGLEASVSYGGGTSEGPEAILDASTEVELFDEDLWREAYRDYGVATLRQPKIAETIPDALDQLEEIVESVLENGQFPIVLGGEHSLTPGAIRPFTRRYDDLAVLHFDAHADLRDGYDGEHFSHAAALRRVLDFKEVTKLVSLGIRNISAGEIPFLEANPNRITTHWARERKTYDPKTIIDEIAGKNVYLTFDLDGFDSSLMPATGTPEPGGLFWDDVMPVIQECGRRCTIVGADVVELAPISHMHGPNFLAAKLTYKLLTAALTN